MARPKTNPYEAPATTWQEPTDADGVPLVSPTRPWPVFFFGAFGIVAGVIGLGGAAMTFVLWDEVGAAMTPQSLTLLPKWYLMFSVPLGALLSVWIFCAGLGLLSMRQWGRRHFVYQTVAAVVLFLVSDSVSASVVTDFAISPETKTFLLGRIGLQLLMKLAFAGCVIWLLTSQPIRQRFAASERYRAAHGRR